MLRGGTVTDQPVFSRWQCHYVGGFRGRRGPMTWGPKWGPTWYLRRGPERKKFRRRRTTMAFRSEYLPPRERCRLLPPPRSSSSSWTSTSLSSELGGDWWGDYSTEETEPEPEPEIGSEIKKGRVWLCVYVYACMYVRLLVLRGKCYMRRRSSIVFYCFSSCNIFFFIV